MSNNDNDGLELESLKINRNKLFKFQEWCAKNETNYVVIIEKLIDVCV